MTYCMDASALIDLGERYYPERFKLFEPIWTHLYQGIDNGEIISVDYIRTELERRADEWRKNFLARADRMFHISQEVEAEYGGVIREIEGRGEFPVNGARARFFSGADPWLVALARSTGDCVVVTSEKKNLAGYGLRPVCDLLNVNNMNLLEYFEANKIGV